MQNLNEVRFIGHVGNDPIFKEISANFKAASFSLATSDTFEKDGNKQPITHWHNCEARNGLAEIVSKYVKKGSPVFVSGKLAYDKYTPEGATKEIVKAKIVLDRVIVLDKNEG